MDNENATNEQGQATPIFSAYRRGYDPDQVDRYVADQHRRLDEAQHRASEGERKLAAAVGQLRELHRRVAVLESEGRPSAPAQPIDTLGERIQRILQEAWEGANALRQSAAQEAVEIRGSATVEAEGIIAAANRKTEAIEEEIERRRSAYLERIEDDRSRALAQLAQLSDQREAALQDLLKTKTMIDTTLREFAPRNESSGKSGLTLLVPNDEDDELAHEEDIPLPSSASHPAASASEMSEESLPETMAVHRLPTSEWTGKEEEPGITRSEVDTPIDGDDETREIGQPRAGDRTQARSAVFDFEEQQPS